MLDNIFDLVSDLIGEDNVNQLTGKRLPGGNQMRRPVKQRPATSRPASRTSAGQTKLTARRDRREEKIPGTGKRRSRPGSFEVIVCWIWTFCFRNPI